MSTKNVVTVDLHYSRETNRTYRFDADVPGPAISTLYVAKIAFEGKVPPRAVRVTVAEVTR